MGNRDLTLACWTAAVALCVILGSSVAQAYAPRYPETCKFKLYKMLSLSYRSGEICAPKSGCEDTYSYQDYRYIPKRNPSTWALVRSDNDSDQLVLEFQTTANADGTKRTTTDAYAFIKSGTDGVYLCPYSRRDSNGKARDADTIEPCSGAFKYKWRVQHYVSGGNSIFTFYVDAADNGSGNGKLYMGFSPVPSKSTDTSSPWLRLSPTGNANTNFVVTSPEGSCTW